MYHIELDVNKNLVVLHLEDFLADDELRSAAEDLMKAVDKLHRGFVVINDISKMKPASQEGAEEIKKAQIYVVQKGVSRIIRVTDNPISKMQFSRTAKAAGYIAENVSTMEEALDMAFETEKVA